MQTTNQILLTIHVIAGSISLILFWIPAFARKANKLHRVTGKWYTYMMWVVVITAALLSIQNALQGRMYTAIFLGFLSLITANPLWYGVVILKNKKELGISYLNTYKAINLLVVVFGAAMLIYGLFYVDEGIRYLMIFFGVLGVISIGRVIKSFRINPSDTEWFKQHYSGMITSGIAAYTAFFAFGGRTFFSQILSNELQLIPWIAPTLIGVIAMRMLDRKYAKKAVA